MRRFVQRRWFLLSLLILIPWGMALGLRAEPQQVSTFPKHLVEIASGWITAIVLLLMALTLENQKLRQAIRRPGSVMWAGVVNLALLPVLGWAMMPLQRLEDFAVGLLVAASVPTTMAACSVWTRKANGNDGVSLLVTIITNGGCFLITPFWLRWGAGSSVELDAFELSTKLFLTALTPIAIGQLLRMIPPVAAFASRAKEVLGTVAQVCILAMIFWASVQGGVKLQSSGAEGINPWPALIVWGSSIALHAAGVLLAWTGGVLWKFPREDTVGVVFSASQKTLPIGIFVAAGLATQGLPLAAFPMLMFHASQLILDTFLVEPLHRWVQRGEMSTAASDR